MNKNMDENRSSNNNYDIQTPLLSHEENQQQQQQIIADHPSRYSILAELGGEDRTHNSSTGNGPVSFLRHRRCVSSSSSSGSTNNNSNGRGVNYSSNLNRILPRDAPFHQSKGNWNIYHVNRFHYLPHDEDSSKDTNPYCSSTFFNRVVHYFCVDWFHSLLYSPTPIILLLLFLFYVLVILFFAALYLILPQLFYGSNNNNNNSNSLPACNMDMKNYLEAIYFSTSTMTTIGYGVSDYYFNDCIIPLILILLQIFVSLAINAVAFGLLFLRLSTSRKRRRTLLFSNKAVIARFQGDLYFMVRIAELATKRHLIQCQVKCYCVRHTRQCNPSTTTSSNSSCGSIPNNNTSIQHQDQKDDFTAIETNYFQMFDMKLQQSQNHGEFLFMALPTVIAHKIDSSSPLMPPAVWYDGKGMAHTWETNCSSGSTSIENTIDKNNEAQNNKSLFQRERQEIETFLNDRDAEIIVLVEGIDEMTCSPLQAKQSYKLDHEEILWDHTFAPCLFDTASSRSGGGGTRYSQSCHCVVDFQKFHHVLPAPLNSRNRCPFTPNHHI